MFRGQQSIPLGRIFGVPISLDWSWFIIFVLMTLSLGNGYYPTRYEWTELIIWAMAALTSLLLFASVLLHELGHALAAMAYKIPVKRIRLLLFGGVAELGDESPRPMAEFVLAVSGPLVSLLTAGVFFLVFIWLRLFDLATLPGLEQLSAMSRYLAWLNLLLAGFNMIPGFPLDGGRALRAITWGVTGSARRATVIAVSVGRLVGYGFIGVGLWLVFTGNLIDGIWLGFIGMFLQNAGRSQLMAQRMKDRLDGFTASEVMSQNVSPLPADLAVYTLFNANILGYGSRTFIITENDLPAGVLSTEQLRTIPRDQWMTLTTGDVMTPFDVSALLSPTTGLWTALQRMELTDQHVLPITDGETMLGVIRRDDIMRFLHNRAFIRMGSA